MDRIGLVSAQSSYRFENILQIGVVMGHRIDAKISPKAASEKVQTTGSENRFTSPKIDAFRIDGHFNASSANRRQCAGVIFDAPGPAYLIISVSSKFRQIELRQIGLRRSCSGPRPLLESHDRFTCNESLNLHSWSNYSLHLGYIHSWLCGIWDIYVPASFLL